MTEQPTDGFTPSKEEFAPKYTLELVRQVFHRWFKFEDDTLLDLALALKVHSYMLDHFLQPLWLVIIGASGDRKSATIEAFNDAKIETFLLNYITPNTLATGQKINVKHDLAPKLNRKLVLSSDFAQFIKMPQETKGAIWSQMREAYDGRIQKATGSGVDTFYRGILWDWLICSTPIIDEELILKDSLGTRELIYRMPDENIELIEEKTMMDTVWNNVSIKKARDQELKDAVKLFCDYWKHTHKESILIEADIPETVKDKLFQYSKFIALLRAYAECDWRTGELTNFVYPEKPTRVLEQLKMLFIALKLLDPEYTDELALKRVFEVVKSSIHPVRLKILKLTLEGELTTTQISNRVGLHHITTNRELQTSKHLKLIDERKNKDNKNEWSACENNEVMDLVKMLKLEEESKNGESTADQKKRELLQAQIIPKGDAQ